MPPFFILEADLGTDESANDVSIAFWADSVMSNILPGKSFTVFLPAGFKAKELSVSSCGIADGSLKADIKIALLRPLRFKGAGVMKFIFAGVISVTLRLVPRTGVEATFS